MVDTFIPHVKNICLWKTFASLGKQCKVHVESSRLLEWNMMESI